MSAEKKKVLPSFLIISYAIHLLHSCLINEKSLFCVCQPYFFLNKPAQWINSIKSSPRAIHVVNNFLCYFTIWHISHDVREMVKISAKDWKQCATVLAYFPHSQRISNQCVCMRHFFLSSSLVLFWMCIIT